MCLSQKQIDLLEDAIFRLRDLDNTTEMVNNLVEIWEQSTGKRMELLEDDPEN